MAQIRTGLVMLSVFQMFPLSSFQSRDPPLGEAGTSEQPSSEDNRYVPKGMCVSRVIVSVSESKVTKVLLPLSPLYSFFFRGRSDSG